jgi:hypothetical protein
MTEQDIFDQALAGIRKQGRPSMDGGGFCLYRGPGGTKCAVGHLLTDAEYERYMEGRSPTTLRLDGSYAVPMPARLEPHRKFLVALQEAHDHAARYHVVRDATFLAAFEREMSTLARVHGLQYTSDNVKAWLSRLKKAEPKRLTVDDYDSFFELAPAPLLQASDWVDNWIATMQEDACSIPKELSYSNSTT